MRLKEARRVRRRFWFIRIHVLLDEVCRHKTAAIGESRRIF
jgi:hypothetical protein